MQDSKNTESSTRQNEAHVWFQTLQTRICNAFEALEDQFEGGLYGDAPAGRFERKTTKRRGEPGPDGVAEDAGGGVMAVMRGRVFEKVGVNVSAVYGQLGAMAQKALTARKEIPGLAEDPRFWAAGISLVAHMRNPRCPAVHMNTRHFWTPGAAWFGGGADINPTIPLDDPAAKMDAADFHTAMETACAAHDKSYYPRFKAWADDYFMIRHWNEARGAGGIFYDDLDTGDWDADFAFTRSVGEAFLQGFPPIVERRAAEPWSEAEKAHQLFRRGRYAEFNLVYDRGTQFGLATGHNPEAVLMSLPPLAAWP